MMLSKGSHKYLEKVVDNIPSGIQLYIHLFNFKEFKKKHIGKKILKELTDNQAYIFVFFIMIEYNTSIVSHIE